MDFYELPGAGLGKFDIVFFLGVLYHVRHPLLALEIVCALTKDVAIVDSFVTDPDDWQEHAGEIPTMEFYELDELGNQFGNWVGPTRAMLAGDVPRRGIRARRIAGHRRSSRGGGVLSQMGTGAGRARGRRCRKSLRIENARTNGINFSTRKSEEYLTCLLRAARDPVTPEMLRLEVNNQADDFGAAASICNAARETPGARPFVFRPASIPAGTPCACVSATAAFGREFRIAVDMLRCRPRSIDREGSVRRRSPGPKARCGSAERGFLSCWARGLPENADRANVRDVSGEFGG